MADPMAGLPPEIRLSSARKLFSIPSGTAARLISKIAPTQAMDELPKALKLSHESLAAYLQCSFSKRGNDL